MIEEKIVVSDTNIFLDLISINLLEDFFNLPCEIHTSDFVVGEILTPEQISAISDFIDSKKLTVRSFDFSDLAAISELQKNCMTNASFTDCSVWYYAKKINARLLTGDNKLRKTAEKDSVLVSGILYIFDNLVEYGILEKSIAAEKLSKLLSTNPRLPHGECQKRISEWQRKMPF